MKRTHDIKPSQSVTSANPTTLNLQTRPFAPLQVDSSQDHQITDSASTETKDTSSKNILQRLISTSNPDPVVPVQRKFHYRLQSSRMAIQAKLSIGEPNDKYEQEADATAAKVVQQINAPQDQSVQRQGEMQESDDELQMKSLVQRRENIGGGEASTDLESSIQSARGGGQSLDAGLQTKMGQAMGADFSSVKVHTDSQSDQLNQSIQAKAFTTGQDVFFRQGAYDPSSQGGQELIAHELTHVVQQGGANNIQAKPVISTIQRVKLKDRIKSYVKNKAKSLGSFGEKSKKVSKNDKGKEKEIVSSLTDIRELSYSERDDNKSNKDEPLGSFGEKSKKVSKDERGKEKEIRFSRTDTGELSYLGRGDNKFNNAKNDKGKEKEIVSSLTDTGELSTYESSDNKSNNYEDPNKYKYGKVNYRQTKYEGEDKDSRETTHVNDIFLDLEEKVSKRKYVSVAQALTTEFGWSNDDVEKYYVQKEKSQVKYLDEESRKDYLLIGGSTLMQGEPPKLFDTSEMFSKYSGKGFGIYVMTPNGDLYSHAHKVGLFHHSSFLAGLPTAGAGEIQVIGGVVKRITNKSGHYLPDDTNMIQVLKELNSRGVNLSGVKLTIVGKTTKPEDDLHYKSAEEFLQKGRGAKLEKKDADKENENKDAVEFLEKGTGAKEETIEVSVESVDSDEENENIDAAQPFELNGVLCILDENGNTVPAQIFEGYLGILHFRDKNGKAVRLKEKAR